LTPDGHEPPLSRPKLEESSGMTSRYSGGVRKPKGIAGGRGIKSWWPTSKLTKAFVGIAFLQSIAVVSIEVSRLQ
jgi:hypothetical protein